jgi:aldehyde:ferredoxin oxidoreductase
MPQYGYAGNILKVNLTDGKVTKLPSAEYTDKYIGGHGLASRLYWEMVPPEAGWADPENCLICVNGPAAGFPGFAGSRWKICAKSPFRDPESYCYANLGEKWGMTLKFAGYDALVVQGKAKKPVYIYIHDDKVEIKDAGYLKGKTTFETLDTLKAELGEAVSTLACSPAGENLVRFATVGAEGGAVGSGGMGAVMGSKNLKAVAVAGDKHPAAANPERLRELAKTMQQSRPQGNRGPSMWGLAGLTHPGACSGCGLGCSREVYTLEPGGRRYRTLCQSSVFYMSWVMKQSKSPFKDDGSRLLATRLCDGYGLDSTVVQSVIEILEACFLENLVTEKQIGVAISKAGTPEFIEAIIKKIAFREGYGELLAKGTAAIAEAIGPKAVAMLPNFIATKANDKKDYDPRMLITTGLCYATEPRRPIQQIHEVVMPVMMWNGMPGEKPGKMFSTEKFQLFAERAWGSAIAADFSTYEGKALAAKKIQDHAMVKESMVTCDLGWMSARFTNVIDPENTVGESQVYTAITGKETSVVELDKTGEMILNLQRAIFLRQGWQGRKDDTLLDYFFTNPLQKGELFFNVDAMVPGKNGEPLSKVGYVVDKEKFEDMKTEYYGYRGWDTATGYPTKKKLKELKLDDVAADLAGRCLAK